MKKRNNQIIKGFKVSQRVANGQDNLLFHSDNLKALSALMNNYKEKIKLIYIDPPYNTGKIFDHYDDYVKHEVWLTEIEKRLTLMKELMRHDGSIWISIDDDEAHYLKITCDKIFGRKNFISTIVWQKKISASNDSRFISDNHEYILVYAKDKSKWQRNLLPREQKVEERYTNRDNDPRGVWTSSDLSVKTPSKKYIYPIRLPSGRIVYPSKSRSWAVSKEKFKKLVSDNRIWFGVDGNSVPRLKRFLKDVQNGLVPKTLWLKEEVGDNQEAKKEIKLLNPDDIFTTPKPERLLERIIRIATNEGDYILDAFAGTGTTGAVADKLNRKWILIEINGVCESHCLPRLKNVVLNNDFIGIPNYSPNKSSGFKYYVEK